MRDVISALKVFKSKKTHYDFVIDFTDNLIEMLDNAEKHNRPMYFIF